MNLSAADTYAVAIVAAASVYGDDPLIACKTDVSQKRRCLAPAAFAVATITGRSRTLACRTVGIKRDSATRRADGAEFIAAERQAWAVLRLALENA